MKPYHPKEWKLVPLRECPPADRACDCPERAAEYWRANIAPSALFNARVESCFVILVNARKRATGHCLVASGLLSELLVHPREVFAPAIVGNASAVILLHNHPSGDPSPSEADIKVTRDLMRAGQLLKIEVLDHVVMGLKSLERARDWVSLRELGYVM
jgi:DNA repair protein RadC